MQPDDLDNIRAEQDAAASEIDALGDSAFNALAGQLKNISPEASAMVLDALNPLLAQMGGAIEGQPTSLADPAVARALSAIADAVQDAVADDVLPAELAFEVGDLVDDQAAALVAGKIAQISKDKAFSKWLKQPVQPAPDKASKTEEPAAEKQDNTASDDDFFASRVSKKD